MDLIFSKIDFTVKHILVFLIKVYKLLLSGFFPASCRFTPACSNYAIKAVEKHGALSGIWMAFRRICRCNPWHSKTGYDPVP